MDEADAMAERDLGSTFLLPHTHLYKPDRVSFLGHSLCWKKTNQLSKIPFYFFNLQASDISGFDSL